MILRLLFEANDNSHAATKVVFKKVIHATSLERGTVEPDHCQAFPPRSELRLCGISCGKVTAINTGTDLK